MGRRSEEGKGARSGERKLQPQFAFYGPIFGLFYAVTHIPKWQWVDYSEIGENEKSRRGTCRIEKRRKGVSIRSYGVAAKRSFLHCPR